MVCDIKSENASSNDSVKSNVKQNVDTRSVNVETKQKFEVNKDVNNDTVLSGRLYRKCTMPLLPGKRSNNEIMDMERKVKCRDLEMISLVIGMWGSRASPIPYNHTFIQIYIFILCFLIDY